MLSEISSAVRLLLRSPGFAITAILTLALGIGANSAVFAVLHSVILKPLPFPEPDRIVRIRGQNELRGWTNGYVTMPDVTDFKEQSSKYAAVAGYSEGVWILSRRGPALGLKGLGVLWDFFPVLGVQPRLGRGFVEGEFAAGAEPAVILSDALWRRIFDADPAILNTVVTLDGHPHHIVGIMPPSFQFPEGSELWVSLTGELSIARVRAYATTNAIARLKPGVTISEARAEAAVIASRIAAEHPNSHQRFTTDVVTLAEDQSGSAREMLQLFLGAVACVLLIACSNVANLMLARATGRSRELAIRAALGATSGQLLRQTMVESLMLSLAGAALGLVFAQAALRTLLVANAAWLPRTVEIRLEPITVIYTILVALLTCVLFGALPALAILKTDVQRALGDRSGVLIGSSNRARMGLVISQFALATILACSAGLLLKTFYKLMRTDPGFQTRQILAADIMLSDPGYETNLTSAYRFYRDGLVAIAEIPGVEQVGAVTHPPLGSGELHRQLGRFGGPANDKVPVAIVGASVGYHKAIGIALRRGRLFEWGDWALHTKFPVILSESLAQRLFGDSDPIGRQVAFSSEAMDVVGVVGDIRSTSLDEPPEPHLYIPLERSMMLFATFAIRSNLPPERLSETVRQALARLDPNVPLINVRTMDEAADRNLAGPRFRTNLLTAVAGAALLLAVVGIYSLLSFLVAQRYREMGVRMALGATSGTVAQLILGQGLRLAVAGIALGLIGAFALGQALGGLIYGIEPLDPVIAAIASTLFVLVSTAASLGPALRAASADPQEILRRN